MTGSSDDNRRGPSAGADATDADLLAAFLADRSEEAFAVIARRHGPMVLQTARRMLGQTQDAEDVFQATFLVLAQKAGSVRPPGRLAAWLYGVASKTSMKARRAAARRAAKEKQGLAMSQPSPPPPPPGNDLSELLDDELNRLPVKYREPVVLCGLQSRPRREVARELGLSDGTLSNRLAAGRRLLAVRLRRRGVVVGAATLALFLAGQASAAAAAPPPPLLVTATVKGAALAAAGKPAAGAVSTAAIELATGAGRNGLGIVAKVVLAAAITLTAGVGGVWAVLVLVAAPTVGDADFASLARRPDPTAPDPAALGGLLVTPPRPVPLSLTAPTPLDHWAVPFDYYRQGPANVNYILCVKKGEFRVDDGDRLTAVLLAYVMPAESAVLATTVTVSDAAGNPLGTVVHRERVIPTPAPTDKLRKSFHLDFGRDPRYRAAARVELSTRIE